MTISMLMTSLLGLITPLAAYTSIWAIFALRVAQVSADISTNFITTIEIIIVINVTIIAFHMSEELCWGSHSCDRIDCHMMCFYQIDVEYG